jgi:hypothetical protein
MIQFRGAIWMAPEPADMRNPGSTCAVQRRRFSCGCETHPVTFTPTGSNWSSQGGNELAGASGVEGHIGVLANTQATT